MAVRARCVMASARASPAAGILARLGFTGSSFPGAARSGRPPASGLAGRVSLVAVDLAAGGPGYRADGLRRVACGSQLLLEAMRLEECAVFTVKSGLTIKTAAAYWVISSKPIARQADQACGRLD